MSRDGGGTLVVAFDDIERLSLSLRTHSEFVRSRIGQVARVATDSGFVASIPLSPFTGMEAETAVAVAVGRLIAHATATEGVALISATAVSTYRLAEESLAMAAAGLGTVSVSLVSSIGGSSTLFVAGQVTAGSIATLFGAALVAVKIAVDSLIAGFAEEFVESLVPGLRTTLDEYAANPALLVGGGALFAAQFGANTGKAFAMNDVFARAITKFEATLGLTGPFFDDILRALIATGNNLGFFVDREAELVKSPLSDVELAKAAKERAEKSALAILGAGKGFALDAKGRIVPTDIASLFASGRQVDDVGKERFATIRIFTCTDNDGRISGYTVQIPSTQSWSLWRSTAPNDLTADLHSMVTSDETALSRLVLKAMDAAGIPSDRDGPPILLTGFSLGGITAASIAASESGHNIQQVLTAGSPIARIAIPGSIDVLAWEGKQDPVLIADAKPNPTTWTTVRRESPLLAMENLGKMVAPNEAHDLDRYARMAIEEADDGTDATIARFFDGNVTITDFYAMNRTGG